MFKTPVNLTYLGHAALRVEGGGRVVLVDPWLDDNPLSPVKSESVERADLILVTHDHHDHIGDAVKIARKTGATIVAVYDLAKNLEKAGVKTLGLNVGGAVTVKGVKVIATTATHSASVGVPIGFVFNLAGVTVYHAGDTGLTYDMKLVGELYKPDIALLPIGSCYTMGPVEACYAVTLVNPKVVVPIHYNTFPSIKQNPYEFKEMVKQKAPSVKVVILKPGETLRWP